MKKLKWILIGLGGILVLWILINQIDGPKPKNIYTTGDLRASYFEPDNGFYLLWGLIEPVEVDITSPEVIQKYRQIFDPPGETDNFQRLKDSDPKRNSTLYEPYRKKIQNISNFFQKKGEPFWERLATADKKKILPLDPDLEILMTRYRMLLAMKDFQDFTEFNFRSPIPNLLALLHISNLYSAIHIQGALEGNWEKNISSIFDQIDAAKMMIKGSRILVLNLVVKALIFRSLKAVNYLMNRKECPQAVYELVVKRMPELKYEEFGSRDSFVGEFLAMASVVSRGKATIAFKIGEEFSILEKIMVFLSYQRNRVTRMHYEFIQRCIRFEKTPPFKWEDEIGTIQMPRTRGAFWWFHNPGGKILNDYWNANLSTVIFKSFRLKSVHDMVRISAELHLKYSSDKPVQEILNELDVYQNLLDPCSGKPYRWNNEKQILYGIGADREDHNGIVSKNRSEIKTDHAVPVILYVK